MFSFTYLRQQAFKMPKPMLSGDAFFDLDDEVRERRLSDLSLPSIAQTGPRVSKVETSAAKAGWKLVHMDYYKGFGLTWPPDMSAATHICLDGLRDREAQVVFLCDAVWPMEHDREYLDVNPKVEMVLQGNFKEDLETEQFEKKKSPWKDHPHTIVGGTKLILRYKTDTDEIVIRAAVSTELMKLIGWDNEQWSHGYDTFGMSAQECHDWNELTSNFAGNAWSAWHFLPIKMATVATIGRFGRGGYLDTLSKGATDTDDKQDAGEDAKEPEELDSETSSETDSR